MREVQDHFFRLAKEEGYLSRAAYKLIEIDERKRILHKGDRVLDCGCAPGSWLQVASKRVGERGSVVGIDLQKIGRKIADNVITVQGDFTTADPQELMALGTGDDQAPTPFDVVLSDMAPSTSGDPEGDHHRSVRLCNAVLERCPALLKVGGSLVLKVFEGGAYMDLVKRCEALFEDARGFKPKASRSESREMYIVAHGWRGIDPKTLVRRPTDVNVLAPHRPRLAQVGPRPTTPADGLKPVCPTSVGVYDANAMPIRAPDPHNLRTAAQRVGVIETDRACPGCGYNLRGLRLGVPCPECGMPAAASYADEIDDPLSLAPPRVILAFIRGCWTASIIVVLIVLVFLAPRYTAWPYEWTRWSLTGLSLLWVGAVAWLTPALHVPQAAMRGFRTRSLLRRLTRWLQWGWMIAATLRALRHELNWSGQSANLANIGITIGFLAGLTGVVMLCIMLERLSNWARDDAAEKLFNFATWLIPISSLMLMIGIPFLPAMIFGRYGMAVTLIWMMCIALFPYALISLSGSVTLSVVHNYEHRERQQRRAERQRRYDEQISRTVDTMDTERARRGHV